MPLMTLRELSAFLTQEGFKLSLSTLKKITAKSRADEGPPAEGFWGSYKLYDPQKALTWAHERLSATAAPFEVDEWPAKERPRGAKRRTR
jgi:hypothetical protein